VNIDDLKQPLNLRLEIRTIRRVKAHAVQIGSSASAIVTALIEEHLPSYGPTPLPDEKGGRS
jgi:hypothetical protein